MSLLLDGLRGSQRPRFERVPLGVSSEGPDAVYLAGSYGLVADEWQAYVLDSWLGVREDGRWAASRCGLSVPRQNGKNALVEMAELYLMVALGYRVLHTAHEVKTARKAFQRLLGFFDNAREFPELAAMVREVRRTNGQEAVVLANGGQVEFVARSKSSGRGFTVDVLVMDEAQELADDQLAALLPTVSASGNPLLVLTGTPPGPSVDGSVFTRTRNAALEGVDGRLCWQEWSCEGVVDLDDPRVWAVPNPATGIRISVETMAAERAAMDDETFARERLGMFSVEGSQRVVSLESWTAVADPLARDTRNEVSLSVDMSPDRASTSLDGAFWWDSPDGPKAVPDVIESRRGAPDWAVAKVVSIHERVRVRATVIDGASPANVLIDPLRDAGIAVTVMNARQAAQAFGGFYDHVMAGTMRHLDQPLLNTALSVARKRSIGDGSGWSRKDSQSDITSLVAATNAVWGLTSTEVAEPVKRRSGEACFV